MPFDIIFLVIAALLLGAEGLGHSLGKIRPTPLAFAFIVLAALVWRY